MFEAAEPDAETERAQYRRERERLRRLRINEAGVALAALALSATALGINFFNYSRGSEVVVLQPEDILLYRQGTAEEGVLTFAVQAAMVNASRDYGDVVVAAQASLLPQAGSVIFAYQNVIEPVRSDDVKAAVADCPDGVRCIAETGFYIMERPKTLLDVPGGGSRTTFLAFPLETWNCRGTEEACTEFQTYAGAMGALRTAETVTFEVVLRYQFDGEHTLRCTLSETAVPGRANRAGILDYLDDKGWTQSACMEAAPERS